MRLYLEQNKCFNGIVTGLSLIFAPIITLNDIIPMKV